MDHNTDMFSEMEDFSVPSTELDLDPNLDDHKRTVLHFDIDCFYAQVCRNKISWVHRSMGIKLSGGGPQVVYYVGAA